MGFYYVCNGVWKHIPCYSPLHNDRWDSEDRRRRASPYFHERW